MWRRIKWPHLRTKHVVIVAVLAATLFAFRKPVEKYFDIAKSLDIFATLFKEVNAYYVDDVEPEKLIRKGIDGMLESLDPYTDYISEDEIESFRITTTGQYGGIGALIGVVNKKTVVTHPYKNFPANKAGIRVGDEIVSVDGKNIQGKTTTEISALLKGQPKTEVELKIKRFAQKENVVLRIRREKITLTNLAYFGLVEPEVGYLKLDDFTPGASREVSEAITKLKDQGAKKIILDLRDNPGGLLHEAVNIVSLFVPRGEEVVSTKGKVDEWNKSYRTLNSPVDTNIPMVVLVSEGSASAAEIVAGALQDYDRGVLIGKRTFGKGLVQTTRQLSYNSQLKVTTAKYYIPSGRCIQALDYTHRKEDGSVDRVADSLKSEFKTKAGRKVFDGGGLDPDVTVEDDYVGNVTAGLVNSGLIFEFASKYCAENPGVPDLKSFYLSDKDYERFLVFVKEQKFTYTTAIENNATKLIEAAKEEKYYSELEGQLSQLRTRIDAAKASDLSRFKPEIKEILEEQIAFHYALNDGQAAVSLTRDKTIVEARKVLNNPEAYHKILTPPDGQILSLETATAVCSVAIHEDEKLIALAEVHLEQSHASKLAVLMDEVSKQAGMELRDLSAVAVSSGPGSYTGLRIGTSAAKGLCYAVSIPLIAIGTLEVLAAQVNKVNISKAWLCPMIDARRMEVYCRLSDTDSKVICDVEAKIIDEKSFKDELDESPIIFFGNGGDKCRDMIRHRNAFFLSGITPTAAQLGAMAWEKYQRNEIEDLIHFEPFYLKDFRIKRPGNIIEVATNKTT